MRRQSLVLALALVFAHPAMAADWQADLVQKEARSPTEAVQFRLPELPVEVLQRLALELDNLDVTAFVSSSDGRNAEFTPPQPLTYGVHRLRLLEYAATGNPVERGVWNLEVRQPGGLREMKVQGQTTFTLVHRLADHNLTKPEPAATQADGAAQVRVVAANGDWRVNAAVDLLGSSNDKAMPRQHSGIDLSNFLVGAENGPVIAQVGHHAVGPDSLVMQGFNRRGVSAGVKNQDKSLSLVGFGMRTEAIVGFRDGLGIGEADNRTQGVTLLVHPRPAAPNEAEVYATVLSGKGPMQSGGTGSGVVGDPTRVSGRAASIGANYSFLDNRLRLRGEAASTRFDADGTGLDSDKDGIIDVNNPSDNGHAYLASLSYMPWRDLQVGGQPMQVTLGVDRRLLSTWFRSPAAASAGNLDLWQGSAGLDWSALHLSAVLSRQQDNVDGLTALPTNRTLGQMLSLSYLPSVKPGEQAWYGSPTLSLTWTNSSQEVIKAGGSITTTGPWHDTQSLAAAAVFLYPTWTWGLTQVFSWDDDPRNTLVDSHTQATTLYAALPLAERLTLTPTLTYSRTEESDPPLGVTPKDRELRSAGLSLAWMASEQISANLGLSYNLDQTSDGLTHKHTRDLNGAVRWTVVPVKERSPGLTLVLDGTYHDDRDTGSGASIAPLAQYQVFLRAIVGLPFAY